MILFIAPNPFKVKEREGYLQRVAAIDALFKDQKKYYSYDFESDEKFAEAVVRADIIYVHSIYRAEEIIDLYPVFGYKIITDLHGVVPEEEALIGEFRRSNELSIIEKKVFEYGAGFITVTSMMANHFKDKYKNLSNKPKWVVLPIFEEVSGVSVHNSSNIAIYAGGAQKWQNIDLIVSAINKAKPEYQYVILTHTHDAFQGIDKIKSDKVTIKTVASSEVGSYYQTARFGFILRDDTTVNNVACPTKLIEYLSFGVIPVVLSPRIGDFQELGYKYITYDEFIEGDFDDSKLNDYAIQNVKVVEKLKKQTQIGKNLLIKTTKGMASHKKHEVASIHLIVSAYSNARARKDLDAAKYQISEQIKIINNYADALRTQERELKFLRSQMPVKLLNKARSVRNILRKKLS